jgi:glucosamine--fructose-6-phosphate aminotransferase (isomerizing)
MAARRKATRIPMPPTVSPSLHNGIIENFRELREELEKMGAEFTSETDTEVVAHLVTQEMSNAVAAALPQLRGAFALAFRARKIF